MNDPVLESEVLKIADSVKDTGSSLMFMAMAITAPIVIYIVFITIRQLGRNIETSMKLRNIKNNSSDLEYHSYTVVTYVGSAELKPATIGVVEDYGVVPVKCHHESVMEMISDLSHMNPTKYPVIKACIDQNTFTILDVKGYSLVDKEKIDVELIGSTVEEVGRPDPPQVNRREWNKSWKE